MSGRPLGLDPQARGTGGVGGIGGVSDVGTAQSDVGLGQFVGGLGAMDILTGLRAADLRTNAVSLAVALDKIRDKSTQNVLASLA